MKRILLLVLTLLLSIYVISCNECDHEWVDATCTTPKYCKKCDETNGKPLGHTYGEWTETKAPSCFEKGTKSRTCFCGSVETQELQVVEHSYDHACDTSCNTEGCDATRQTEHVYDNVCDPTCNTVGCGSTRQITHAYTNVCDTTCNTVGCGQTRQVPHVYDHNCDTTCNTVGCDATRQIQHVYDNDCDATCNTSGCGATRQAPHNYTDVCDATCNTAGCGATRTPPHNYSHEVTLPTCEVGGYTTYTCTKCQDTYTGNEVAAHGHAYSDWTVYSPVTSSSNGGIKRYNCLNCMVPKDVPLAVVASGNLGGYTNNNTLTDAVKWILYEDGTLKLEGTGVTYDCGWNGANQPYLSYRSQIKRAIVGEGITYIRGGAFAYMENIEEYELPSTLEHLTGNTFMQSFKKGITEFRLPASVNYIGICIAGPYSSNVTNTALFTDIYIENPNITFHNPSLSGSGENYVSFNTYVKYNPELRIYSYGTNNNVSAYCEQYGFTYYDLNTTVAGSVDNLSYSVFNGNMKLSAKNPTQPITLPTSQPWLEKIDKTSVTSIEITASITEIPSGYFKDYTELKSVTLPTTLKTIGSEAFAVSTATSTALTIKAYDQLTSVASDFLKNRTGVTINGMYGTALDKFSQNGVTLNLKKSIKILLVGNSLSQDAADYTSDNKQSQLYNIIKSMVGDNCYVKIGALCSGAKSAGWHATVAESNAAVYQFSIISDDTNGLWKSTSGVTSQDALTSDKWDYITIQPYAAETLTGVGASYDTDAKPQNIPVKDEKFYALSASLPYLLDHFNKYCPDAKIYYYLTWSNYYDKNWTSSSNLSLYGNEAEFVNKRLPVARTAMTYTGTNSGKGFDGLIAGGTAIQNARSTYLGTQFYTTYNNPPAANKPDTTSWLGLQRDDVHLSFSTGRYIVGLAFAEILVPEDYRLDNYTLPDIVPTVKGELPKSHTALAQLCVQKMLETSKLTGDEQYKITRITGYETE